MDQINYKKQQAQILVNLLESKKFEEAALKGKTLIKKFNVDIIILDVMMPKMDGIEACEIIRKKPKIKHTLITFLSARGEDYSQIAGFNAGADDYITKPIKPKILLSITK